MKNTDERDEILIVDDTPVNLKVLEHLLRQAGYEVRFALDGELALRSVALKPPALILLDINMPGMDGIEVCRRLKADTQTRDIPIIFISMLDDEQAKIRAFEAGGVDYINTPFSETEVLARVNTHLRLRQAQKTLERRYAELIEFEERLQAELEQRERAEASLQQAREHLEDLVAARTAQLEQEIADRKRAEAQINEQLKELQAWHTVTLNRETRILELKQEVNEILAQVGKPFRYQLPDSQTDVDLPDDSSFAPPLLIKDIGISEEIMQKWQTIVDMISELLQTPATLIMKVEPPEITVFVSSYSPQNPYHQGERAALNTGLYCETVMATRQKLLVPNALHDAQWDHNPDIALGMISYLGFPICWPNGEMFGTICTLDAKEHAYNDLYQRLLLQFRDVIQTDLKHLLDVHSRLAEEIERHRHDVSQSRRALLSMLEDARRTEAALQESEARYRQIVETSQEGVWLVDLQGNTLYVNRRMAEMLGYSIDEILGRPFWQFLASEQHQDVQAALQRRQEGVAEIIERCFIRKDDSTLWVLNSASPIRDVHGNIIGSMGMLADITDRKQAEYELRRLNAYNRSLIEISLDPLVTIGADGKIMDVNTATEVATGYSRNVLIGKDFSEYFTEPERARAGYQKVFRDGVVRDYSLELRHRDGHVTSVLYNAVVYRDEAGAVLGVFAAARDITERKQNDARVNALLRLNQMINASVAQIADFAMDEGIFLTGSTMGFLIFLNDDEAIGVVHAWSKNAMAGCAILDKPMRFVIAETGLWGEVIRQRRPIILNDYAAPHPSKKGFPPGHVAITRYLSIPVFDAGRVVAVAAVANKQAAYTDSDARQLQLFMEGMWNIIRRKQAEEELRRANNALEIANAQLRELNANKDTFFSIIAHDLKNPLNSFLAFAEILEQLDEYAPSERQKIINEFRISAEHLFRLLENLLTWAHSQQGRLPYAPRSLDLDMLAAFVLESVRPQANNKQIQLMMNIPDRMPVMADMDMLETIFRNLVTNAIKFTPKGGSVTISAQQTDDGVEIAVSDTGIGMTAETSANLFQLGAKTRHLGTAGEKGTGLGLILCKEFVQRHGGTICCESAIGQGSVFHITLPTPQADVT